MICVTDLHVFYGNIHALKGISFEVHDGEICTLIGANGAGKTTTLHTLSHLVSAKSGAITFLSEDITHCLAADIVKKGLIQVPEGRRVFANLSVFENLEMGAYLRKDSVAIKKDFERVFSLFPRLEERKTQLAGTLSGGEQQMLAIGRALMSKPKLLLLDEPSMGLAPILVDEIFTIIKSINDEGTTVLLVEQNAFKALSIADRAYVLETGSIVRQGSGKELLSDTAIRQAYLGL